MEDLNNFKDLLHAYAIGCLDDEESTKLTEYLLSGGEYLWHELGEYQSLVSLLPSILEIETPAPSLKDKVARKLYRIKDQVRAKKTAEINAEPAGNEITESNSEPSNNFTPNSNDEDHADSVIQTEEPSPASTPKKNEISLEDDENIETESLKTKTEEFEVVTPRRKTSGYFRPHQETQIRGREPNYTEWNKKDQPESEIKSDPTEFDNNVKNYEDASEKKETVLPPISRREKSKLKRTQDPPKKKRQSSRSSVVYILIIIILLFGLAAVYFTVSSNVKAYRTDINNLNRQLSSLSQKATLNQEFQDLLTAKDVSIVNLTATGKSPDSYGKLIMSLNAGKGFLQIDKMPQIGMNRAFQLWVAVKGGYVSLGVFNPNSDRQYYPFPIPELSNRNGTKFILTEEPSTGSQSPSKNIYLSGELK